MTKILKNPADYAVDLIDAGLTQDEIKDHLWSQRDIMSTGYRIDTERAVEKALRIREISALKVGDGVSLHRYSDTHSATIIKRTAKTMTVQRDRAERLHSAEDLGFQVGGFSAHAMHQDAQRWKLTPDPEGQIETIRLTKNGWCQKRSKYADVSAGRRYYYDYNF